MIGQFEIAKPFHVSTPDGFGMGFVQFAHADVDAASLVGNQNVLLWCRDSLVCEIVCLIDIIGYRFTGTDDVDRVVSGNRGKPG
ncbi:hypothetical protein D3C71_1570820 [compost metagenome]